METCTILIDYEYILFSNSLYNMVVSMRKADSLNEWLSRGYTQRRQVMKGNGKSCDFVFRESEIHNTLRDLNHGAATNQSRVPLHDEIDALGAEKCLV